MKLELKELSQTDGLEIFEMIREIGLGENGFTNNIPISNFEEFSASLRTYVDISNAINLPDQYVPQTVYWLYVNDKPVGYGKLRHYLNDKLREYGGHIGYIIRPTERGKGNGTIFLAEILNEAKKRQIIDVLITCDEVNLRSRRVIEGNGGKLEEIKNGICKYWIRNN